MRLRTRLAPRLAGFVVLAALLGGCAPSSYPYRWNIFVDSIFRPDALILSGLALTVSISVISQLIGVALGIFGAVGRLSRLRPIRWLATFYVWFFRGTPLLVQIMLIFFGLGVTRIYGWPDFAIGPIPVSGAVQAGIVALGLNEGAYMTEIVRAGILAIDPGQMEAAKALGMTYGKAMRRIVLPQAARVIVPPLGNEFNNMLKTTSLLVVISVPELFVIFSRKNASGSTVFHPLELFLAAAVWYLLLTTAWSIVQYFIERRLGRGVAGAAMAGPSLRERLAGFRLGSSSTGGR
ncbi:MAG TPA: amino acid ABC transporter permease [Candidatus Limnocylindria bacterium]|jgi:polar amino acid transport system permease protein